MSSVPDSSSISVQSEPSGQSSEQPATASLAKLRALWGRYINPRTASWLITIALLAAIGLGVLAYNGIANALTQHPANTAATTLQGNTLGGVPAPNIILHDQSGALISLSQFQGHPIVLTFIDSQCPHTECALTAVGLRSAVQLLGKDAKNVVWVALSMNPTDTPATAKAFIKNNSITFPFHFLIGDEKQLAPLWAAYHQASQTQANGIVIHTTGVFVIDQHAREQVYLDIGFDPQMLANDVHYVLTHN